MIHTLTLLFTISFLFGCDSKKTSSSKILARTPVSEALSLAKPFELNAQIINGGDYLDYLISDVCVNANDVPISGDPYTCPIHRNIRIGERLPYLITDLDSGRNVRYQLLSSIPVVGTDGKLKVLVTKNGQGNFTANYRYNMVFTNASIAYDLIDPNGNAASVIRTFDGGCFDQLIYQDSTKRHGGWPLFAPSLLDGSLRHSIFMRRIEPELPANCPRTGQSSGTTLSVWNRPVPVRFESGKTMNAIVTYHFSHYSLDRVSNALERFYFTKEYGFTRWEAWIPKQKCLDQGGDLSRCDPRGSDNSLRQRCNPTSPIPGVDFWGGKEWVRVDCRDSTFEILLTKSITPLDFTQGTGNNVKDIDVSYNFLLDSEVFDPDWYLANHPDLLAAFGRSNRQAATGHWLEQGIIEGRAGHPQFSVRTYLAGDAQLREMFGTRYRDAIIHYVKQRILE